MINNNKTILITASGTATAVNIIKRLSGMRGVRIITTDSNPAELIAAPSRWSTTHYQVPLASDRDAFISNLVEICEKELVDAVYPIHDAEILAVLEMQASFPARVNLPSLTPKVIINCNDKWINSNICREANLPSPLTFLGSSLQETTFAEHGELVRKPRNGVGSVGVRRVRSFNDVDLSCDLSHDVIYQVPCEGPEFTIDVLKLDDYFVAVARERIETKSGVSTKARVFIDPWLTEVSLQIANVFGLQGLFCFQMMGDPLKKNALIIDINPRCGGGTALTSAAGYPLYEIYFSDLLKLENGNSFRKACAQRVTLSNQVIVCRFFEEVVTHTT